MSRTYEALVCAGDALLRQTLSSGVTKAGHEVVGEAATGFDAVELARMVTPDLIVIDNGVPGRPGVEFVAELAHEHPLSAVLLVANDRSIRERAVEQGAFGVVYLDQLTELAGALGRAAAWLSDPDRQIGERRTGRDRRQRQDWTKVTTERRSGRDRRGGSTPEEDGSPR